MENVPTAKQLLARKLEGLAVTMCNAMTDLGRGARGFKWDGALKMQCFEEWLYEMLYLNTGEIRGGVKVWGMGGFANSANRRLEREW